MLKENWQLDALPVGASVNGYKIQAILGHGGFGITYRAQDTIQQHFAIKELFPRSLVVRQGLAVRPVSATDGSVFDDCRTDFMREATNLVKLARMAGPDAGIVKVHTLFEANGTAYMVMDLVEGQTLEVLLRNNPAGIPSEQLNNILYPLLAALEVVHKAELLHLDIKPANIIIRPDGRPMLLDFGAVRSLSLKSTSKNKNLYSEGYAPPEQCSGSAQQGKYSDIYSLGMTLYRLIGGRLVDEQGEPITAVSRQKAIKARRADPLAKATVVGAGKYAHGLLDAIDRAVELSWENRPETVSDFRALISAGAPPEGPFGPTGGYENDSLTKRKRLIRTPVGYSLCGLCLIVGSVILARPSFLEPPQPVSHPTPPPPVVPARVPPVTPPPHPTLVKVPPGSAGSEAPHSAVTKPQAKPAEPVDTEHMDPLPLEAIQYALKGTRHFQGRVDGKAGPLTHRAIQEWQDSNGFLSDGNLTASQTKMLIEMAANAGQAETQNTLGIMYAVGERGGSAMDARPSSGS